MEDYLNAPVYVPPSRSHASLSHCEGAGQREGANHSSMTGVQRSTSAEICPTLDINSIGAGTPLTCASQRSRPGHFSSNASSTRSLAKSPLYKVGLNTNCQQD